MHPAHMHSRSMGRFCATDCMGRACSSRHAIPLPLRSPAKANSQCLCDSRERAKREESRTQGPSHVCCRGLPAPATCKLATWYLSRRVLGSRVRMHTFLRWDGRPGISELAGSKRSGVLQRVRLRQPLLGTRAAVVPLVGASRPRARQRRRYAHASDAGRGKRLRRICCTSLAHRILHLHAELAQEIMSSRSLHMQADHALEFEDVKAKTHSASYVKTLPWRSRGSLHGSLRIRHFGLCRPALLGQAGRGTEPRANSRSSGRWK